MALNPPLNEIGEPFRIEGEHFIMQRKGIEFEIKVEGLGKFKGNGMVCIYNKSYMCSWYWQQKISVNKLQKSG